jgi:hypothetical protein
MESYKSGLITIVGEPVAGDDVFGHSKHLQIWSLGYKKRCSAGEIDRFYCGEKKINNADHASQHRRGTTAWEKLYSAG